MAEQRDCSLLDLDLIADQDVFCFRPESQDIAEGARSDAAVAAPSGIVIPFRPRVEAAAPGTEEVGR
jgi:hypothetical protein